MPVSPLSNVDLNLLLPLKALLEERNVTRAAKRVHLSQPAMSRTLERLRETLGDDLLIRSQGGYTLTARGTKLLHEVDLVIPRLEALWSGGVFVPHLTTARVRMVMTDMAALLMLPCLVQALSHHAPNLRVEVVPWSERVYEELTTGSVDLVFSPVAAPSPLKVERLFEESFLCVLADSHPFQGKSLLIEQYMALKHVAIDTQAGQQTLVDRPLAEAGYRRDIWLRLPYFLPAFAALRGTDYVLTSPLRLTQPMLKGQSLRAVKAPPEIPGFSYFMVWHPRLESEAMHSWFRQLVLNLCQKEFGQLRG